MMQRKIKLRILQFSLLFIGIIIALFTYIDSDQSSRGNKILLETKKERTVEDLKNSSSDNINIFYNIEYSGLDLSGNRYILNSKEARTSASNTELINMKGVKTVFYFKDGTILNVTSKFGIYNNKTLDMIFEENIIADYGDSNLTAENAEYSNSKGLLTITNKVKINDNRGNLIADKLLFDLKNQTLNIASLSKSKINAKIKLNEKRF
jgi:lipopolysaccharide assembly outer membrane protein LptD (OstA)